MGKFGTPRLDSETAIMRNIVRLLRQGTSREQVEEELVRQGPVDLDLLSAIIKRIDASQRYAG